MRLRFILPALHIVVVLTLLAIGGQQLKSTTGHRLYADFGPPATRLAYAINAPVSIARSGVLALWDTLHLPHGVLTDTLGQGLFVIGVVILWFCVGAEIELRMKCRRWILESHASLRIGISVLFILVGSFSALLGWGTWTARQWRYVPNVQAMPEAGFYLLWAITLIIVYARDLLNRLIPRRSAPTHLLDDFLSLQPH